MLISAFSKIPEDSSCSRRSSGTSSGKLAVTFFDGGFTVVVVVVVAAVDAVGAYDDGAADGLRVGDVT